jgi:predicted nucleotidyltransferase
MPKTKKAPLWLKNRFVIRLYETKVGILFSNWLTQNMLYAEWVEVLFRICLEFTIFCVISALFWIINDQLSIYNIIIIVLLTHTTTFLVNGQFFVLLRFFKDVYNDPVTLIEYPEGICKRLRDKKSILAAVLFGSISRKNFSSSSDLDVRIIAQHGIIDNFIACFWVFLERFIALLRRHPLDIYVITENSGLEKIRTDEMPIILFDKDNFFETQYDKYLFYEDFKDDYKRKSDVNVRKCET